MEWKHVLNKSQVVLADEGKDYLISYINEKKTDFQIEETALLTFDDKYYILKGDFRKEFEQSFADGLEACMDVFNKFKDTSSSIWSD